MFSVKNRLKGKVLFSLLALSSLLCAADLKMATTTSTGDTGLLDVLVPKYKADTGVDLKWVAVGTGNALKLGENCDVSVLFVHSPSSEKTYMVHLSIAPLAPKAPSRGNCGAPNGQA